MGNHGLFQSSRQQPADAGASAGTIGTKSALEQDSQGAKKSRFPEKQTSSEIIVNIFSIFQAKYQIYLGFRRGRGCGIVTQRLKIQLSRGAGPVECRSWTEELRRQRAGLGNIQFIRLFTF